MISRPLAFIGILTPTSYFYAIISTLTLQEMLREWNLPKIGQRCTV